MSTEDVHKLCSKFPDIKVVAVHMEAWNHCRLARKDLEYYIHKSSINNIVLIPKDGELLNFSHKK